MKRYAPLAGTIAGTISFAIGMYSTVVDQKLAMGLAVVQFFVTSVSAAYNWAMPRAPVVPTE